MGKHDGKTQRAEARQQAKLAKYQSRREKERARKGGGKHVRLGRGGKGDSGYSDSKGY